jgi:hypothetical protein
VPNLQDESIPSPEDMRIYLGRVLPGSHLTNAPVDSPYQPLLLLQTAHVMAAFGFSNGDMRRSYETLYSSFKRYYSEQGGRRDLRTALSNASHSPVAVTVMVPLTGSNGSTIPEISQPSALP